MRLFVFCVVSASLHVTYQNPTRQWSMKPHVLLVGVDGTSGRQSLSCLERPQELPGTLDKDADISWRKNGEEEAQRGNAYVIELKETLGGGNYTCHSQDGTLLNHTEVLIQDDATDGKIILVKAEHGDYLHCAAQNHTGQFHCSWKWHSRRVGKVAFVKARRVSYDRDTECSVSGQRWTCSSGRSDSRGRGILCLDQQHCPYTEERRMIQLTVYMKTEDFLVESYSKYFYLSQIVKPDKVTIRKINTTRIAWNYPSSWSRPHSYFPLTFQIVQFRGRRKMCADQLVDSTAFKPFQTSPVQSTCQLEVKRRVKAVCIRAQSVPPSGVKQHQLSSVWSHLLLPKNTHAALLSVLEERQEEQTSAELMTNVTEEIFLTFLYL
ncbi:interleukin 12Ba precursor isoform 2-T9 [Spinachia spinachia]